MQSGSCSGASEALGVELDDDDIAQSLLVVHFPEDTEGGENGNRCSQSVAIAPTQGGTLLNRCHHL